jgi:hypothetical protein
VTPKKIAAAYARVREFCLTLPDTEEKLAWGEPTFRVHGRLFVMFANDHHSDGRIAIWCTAPDGAQRDLVASNATHFFVPPYVGVSGWIGVRLDTGFSWKAIAAIIEEAHRTSAAKAKPKKRAAKRAPHA